MTPQSETDNRVAAGFKGRRDNEKAKSREFIHGHSQLPAKLSGPANSHNAVPLGIDQDHRRRLTL
jgi:hypothetical protein